MLHKLIEINLAVIIDVDGLYYFIELTIAPAALITQQLAYLAAVD